MACLCHQALRRPSTYRSVSASARRAISLGLGANDRELVKDVVPAYPYPTKLYKQASQGLYGGSKVEYGNNTNEKYRTKMRRTWHPNVRSKRIYSKALDQMVHIRVTTRVLRTIDKLGGLDEYLLGEKEARVKELGEAGWWLRWALMQTQTVKDRFAAQRVALGLPPEPVQDASTVLADEVVDEFEAAEEIDAAVEQEDVAGVATSPDAKGRPFIPRAVKPGLEFRAYKRNKTMDSLARPEPVSQEDLSTSTVMDRLEQGVNKLTFRVDKNLYLTLQDGQWKPIKSQRIALVKAMKVNSPTGALKTWEREQIDRQENGLPEPSPIERQAWFQEKQKLYELAVRRFARTKLHDIYDRHVPEASEWWEKVLPSAGARVFKTEKDEASSASEEQGAIEAALPAVQDQVALAEDAQELRVAEEHQTEEQPATEGQPPKA